MKKRLFILTVLLLMVLTACGTDKESKVSQRSTAVSEEKSSESDSKNKKDTEEKIKLSYEVNGKQVKIDAKVITTSSGYNITVPEDFGVMENEYEGIDEIYVGEKQESLLEMTILYSEPKELDQVKKDSIHAHRVRSKSNSYQEIDLALYPELSQYDFYHTSSQNGDIIKSNYYSIVKYEDNGRALLVEYETDLTTEDENTIALMHAMAATLKKDNETTTEDKETVEKDTESKKITPEPNVEVDYNGKWVDENNSRFLTIEDYADNKAMITFDYCWNNCASIGSTDQVEVEFSSNKGSLEYEDDGWGNSGKVLIELNGNQIIIQHNDEEKLTLTKYQPN